MRGRRRSRAAARPRRLHVARDLQGGGAVEEVEHVQGGGEGPRARAQGALEPRVREDEGGQAERVEPRRHEHVLGPVRGVAGVGHLEIGDREPVTRVDPGGGGEAPGQRRAHPADAVQRALAKTSPRPRPLARTATVPASSSGSPSVDVGSWIDRVASVKNSRPS